MGSILSIIGLFILAVLKLEQFVYGKSGKQQSTTGHMARRGLANLAGLIAFDHSTVSSKSVVVRKGAVTKQPLKSKKLLVDYMKSTNNFFVFLSKKGPEGPFSLV